MLKYPGSRDIILVCTFLYFHTLCMQEVKALSILLLNDAVGTKILTLAAVYESSDVIQSEIN